ncbi:hypothetical protein PoB_000157700 [Plakobranchus ocellatus]|uniref:Uncharacterized protein n=1 Tax=Plakobranchus ocellatus TaxID=259542 RepID=A0AAV3XY72_9GAST|nr:hypothetical protein PoB_000157700 [Plakobranchus ocellatus]
MSHNAYRVYDSHLLRSIQAGQCLRLASPGLGTALQLRMAILSEKDSKKCVSLKRNVSGRQDLNPRFVPRVRHFTITPPDNPYHLRSL